MDENNKKNESIENNTNEQPDQPDQPDQSDQLEQPEQPEQPKHAEQPDQLEQPEVLSENQQDTTQPVTDLQVGDDISSSKYFKMTKLQLIIGGAFLILLTAVVTAFIFSNGEDEIKLPTVSAQKDEFAEFYDAYKAIKKNYYEDIDDQKLINGAINGMVESLDDPYSDFMSLEEASSFHESISASFQGIGAEIQQKDNHIVVVSPIKGSPAESAGIKPEDIILEVDGKSLQGMTASEAVQLIRGEKETTVELKIQRPGDKNTMKLVIKRDTIPIETVYAEMLEDNIAKIQVTSFSESTAEELEKNIIEMQDKEMKGMVLDLRQNPGGLLDQAINMVNLFIPNGEIILQVEDRTGKKDVIKAKNSGSNYKVNVPVVVLIDKGSASASEIMASALKESAGIPLVGVTSFGKGTVQSAQDLVDGSNLKYTTAKWLTPKGNWIHKKGIKPDYEVELPDYADLTYINPESKLAKGVSSQEVENAKKMLKALGNNPGTINSYYDDATEQAVKSFQKSAGLKETGVIEGETTNQLMIKLRDKLNNNDTQLKKAIEVLKKQK